jgi:hypothetical protein
MLILSPETRLILCLRFRLVLRTGIGLCLVLDPRLVLGPIFGPEAYTYVFGFCLSLRLILGLGLCLGTKHWLRTRLRFSLRSEDYV